jgi:FMN reductase
MGKNRLEVVGLGGSLAQHSTSLAALRIALEGAAEAVAVVELLDIKDLSLPMYDPANREPPASVIKMCEAIYQADGLIWSSPMYNGTISGSFKNALDWLILLGDRHPPYLTDKVVGLISTAGGVQGLQAVNTMEFVVRALRGWAVPLVMPIAQSWKAFDKKGVPQQSELVEQLHALGREVARSSYQFAQGPPTKGDTMKAEVKVSPLTDDKALIASSQQRRAEL